MTMDGQKQAITRRSWDDARFESVVGALGKVKVPKVKKPQKEEQAVDMSKQALDRPPLPTLTIPQLLAIALARGGVGGALGAAYGAGGAPKGEKVRGAVQKGLPIAGAVGGATLGSGFGGRLGAQIASGQSPHDKAIATLIGAALGGAGGGFGGLQLGKGIGKAVTGAPVGSANTEPEMKQAGCGGKKKKKFKKGK